MQTHLHNPVPDVAVHMPALMTQEQAAKYLGKSVQWFERCRWAGEGIPYIKIGRSVRYRATDLIEYLEQNTVQTEQGGAH